MNKFKLICVFYQTLMLISFTYGANNKCPKITKYYNALQCTPLYKTNSKECPYKYNCDHLKLRSRKKCYANGNEYQLNEELKGRDAELAAGACYLGCFCDVGDDGIAMFMCAVVDCLWYDQTPECYTVKSPVRCCAEMKCVKNPQDRPTCKVDGVIYKEGESFNLKSDPDKICNCLAGYKGENIEPFCVDRFFDPYFTNPSFVINNCAPIYRFYGVSDYRCPNKDDKVIKDAMKKDNDIVCRFGKLNMRKGDILNSDKLENTAKCVCEVGPLPTCEMPKDW